jgi:zinc and cadmium transporter
MIWWTEAILASIITSFVSLIGIAVMMVQKKYLAKVLTVLVAVAAGTLLGDAFIHLIPEAISGGASKWPWGVIGGMLLFFALEKILQWHHCHEDPASHKNAKISLAADAIHNLIDGMMIGASFSIGHKLGVATTLAIMLHEIPQEIGDFAIMVQSGLSYGRAIWLNFLSACFSLVGVIIVMMGGGQKVGVELSALSAGGFIYLAASDLIPELHRHDSKLSQSIIELLAIVTGVALIGYIK